MLLVASLKLFNLSEVSLVVVSITISTFVFHYYLLNSQECASFEYGSPDITQLRRSDVGFLESNIGNFVFYYSSKDKILDLTPGDCKITSLSHQGSIFVSQETGIYNIQCICYENVSTSPSFLQNVPTIVCSLIFIGLASKNI